MSTSQPFPIQVSSPAKPGAANAPVQAESSDTDSKGVFGGVLTDVSTEITATEVNTEATVVEATANVSLPLDGNSLPLAINTQLQADIAEISDDISEELLLSEEPVDVLGINIPVIESQIKASVSTLVEKDPVLSSRLTVPTSTETIRIINSTPLQPVKAETVNQSISLLPFADAGIDAETQAVTQFKESLQLQKIFSPLTRQAEAGIEAGQLGRVIEKFTELNQKQLISPSVSVSSPVNSSPLSTTGTAATAQLSIDVPVQDPRWQKAFSQRVVWSVGNVQSAQLRLNPAELGRIDIQLDVDNDKANVVFTTQQGGVKDVIEQALPRLRDMLAEQGVDLENVEIFHDNFNQQQAGNENGSSQQQESENSLWSGAQEQEQVDNDVFVSQVAFNEDVVDYYV